MRRSSSYPKLLAFLQSDNCMFLPLQDNFDDRFNIESYGFSIDENGNLGFEKRYHSSGHASGEDITWAAEQIDPDYIVPIHTEARGWFAKSFENGVLVEESKKYDF